MESRCRLVSRLIFQAVHWAARKGLREWRSPAPSPRRQENTEARQTGIRGETYAYWYLRRQGYIFIARNFTPRASKGEIDMVGYDGKTLAFVEVRTRTVREEMSALPEKRHAGQTTPPGPHRAAIPGGAPRPGMPLPVRRRRDRQLSRQAAGSAPAQGRLQPSDVKFHRKILGSGFSAPPEAVQSEPRAEPDGALSALKSLTPFEEDCFAGVAKRPDYWPLGDYFHGTRQAPKRFSARERGASAKRQKLPVLLRQ